MNVEIHDADPSSTPPRVAAAIEEARASRDRSKRRASTSDRDRFFGRLAELRKRAER